MDMNSRNTRVEPLMIRMARTKRQDSSGLLSCAQWNPRHPRNLRFPVLQFINFMSEDRIFNGTTDYPDKTDKKSREDLTGSPRNRRKARKDKTNLSLKFSGLFAPFREQ